MLAICVSRVVALSCTVLTSIAFDLHLFPILAYLPGLHWCWTLAYRSPPLPLSPLSVLRLPFVHAEMGDTKAVLKLSGFQQGVNSTAQFIFVIVGIACSVVMPIMLGTCYMSLSIYEYLLLCSILYCW